MSHGLNRYKPVDFSLFWCCAYVACLPGMLTWHFRMRTSVRGSCVTLVSFPGSRSTPAAASPFTPPLFPPSSLLVTPLPPTRHQTGPTAGYAAALFSVSQCGQSTRPVMANDYNGSTLHPGHRGSPAAPLRRPHANPFLPKLELTSTPTLPVTIRQPSPPYSPPPSRLPEPDVGLSLSTHSDFRCSISGISAG